MRIIYSAIRAICILIVLLATVFTILAIGELFTLNRQCDAANGINWTLCLLRADGNLTGGVLGSAGAIFAAWIAWQGLKPQIALSRFQSAAQVFQGLQELSAAISNERFACERLRFTTSKAFAAQNYAEQNPLENLSAVEVLRDQVDETMRELEAMQWDLHKVRFKSWDNESLQSCRTEIESTNLKLRMQLLAFKRVLIESIHLWKTNDDIARAKLWPQQVTVVKHFGVKEDAQRHMSALVKLLVRLNEEDRKLDPLLAKAWNNFSSFA